MPIDGMSIIDFISGKLPSVEYGHTVANGVSIVKTRVECVLSDGYWDWLGIG